MSAECGLACMSMIAAYHGHPVELRELRQRAHLSTRGTTLAELLRLADELQLRARVVQVEPSILPRLRLPAILHWDMSHFVVLKSVGRHHVVLHDPAKGEQKISLEEVGRSLTGIAIELAPDERFVIKDERNPLRLTDLASHFEGHVRSFVLLAVIAMLSQLFMLIIPYYSQVVIDRVVPQFDLRLLNLVFLLFLCFVLLDWAIRHLRNILTLHYSSLLNSQLSVNLFTHLIRLPLSFFENRNYSELVSMFDSLDEVRTIVAEDAVQVIVNGLMCIAVLCVLVTYDVWLLVCLLVFILGYAAFRVGTFQAYKSANQNQLLAKIKERAYMSETVRGIQSIKAFGAESARAGHWRNLFNDLVVNDRKVEGHRVAFQLSHNGVFAIENLISMYICARLVLMDQVSFGMVFAFFAYKRLFTDACVSLIETLFKFRLLSINLQRLSDIVREPREAEGSAIPQARGELEIQVSNAGFRHPGQQGETYANVNFRVKPGERIALVGPSGAGKTTFLKVLLKLLPEQSGQIIVDGVPLESLPRSWWLAQVGVVMQNDFLFVKSIRENIALGQLDIDDARVREVARLACVLADIEALPMQFESRVMELGAGLSAGQIQRILIARALYKNPRLLVMDEGTANLDQALELEILDNIRQIGISVIQAAHRPQVIVDATRVVEFGNTLS
jgi:ATP-binding cassette subfamily B protein RaxB